MRTRTRAQLTHEDSSASLQAGGTARRLRQAALVPLAIGGLLLAACDGGADGSNMDHNAQPSNANAQSVADSSADQDTPTPGGHGAQPTAPAPNPTMGNTPEDGAATVGAAGMSDAAQPGGAPRMEDRPTGLQPGQAVVANGQAATLCRMGNGYGVSFIVAAQGTDCGVADATASALFHGHTPGDNVRNVVPATVSLPSGAPGGADSMQCEGVSGDGVRCTGSNNPAQHTVYLY